MIKIILRFLKRFWLIILLATIASLLLINHFWFSKKKTGGLEKPNLTPIPTLSLPTAPFSKPSWNGIIPGESLKTDVEEILGSPSKQEFKEGKQVYLYSSSQSFPNLFHEIIFSQNQVAFIKVKTTDKELGNLNDYLQRGSPDKVLYGPFSPPFLYYLFLNQGTVIVAVPDEGTILEAWYFQKLSLSEFLKTWGKELELNQPERF